MRGLPPFADGGFSRHYPTRNVPDGLRGAPRSRPRVWRLLFTTSEWIRHDNLHAIAQRDNPSAMRKTWAVMVLRPSPFHLQSTFQRISTGPGARKFIFEGIASTRRGIVTGDLQRYRRPTCIFSFGSGIWEISTSCGKNSVHIFTPFTSSFSSSFSFRDVHYTRTGKDKRDGCVEISFYKSFSCIKMVLSQHHFNLNNSRVFQNDSLIWHISTLSLKLFPTTLIYTKDTL